MLSELHFFWNMILLQGDWAGASQLADLCQTCLREQRPMRSIALLQPLRQRLLAIYHRLALHPRLMGPAYGMFGRLQS